MLPVNSRTIAVAARTARAAIRLAVRTGFAVYAAGQIRKALRPPRAGRATTPPEGPQ